MNKEVKDFLCTVCCLATFVLALVTLISTSFTITDMAHKVSELNTEVDYLKRQKEAQDKTIEAYKQYVDNVGKCIIEGKW